MLHFNILCNIWIDEVYILPCRSRTADNGFLNYNDLYFAYIVCGWRLHCRNIWYLIRTSSRSASIATKVFSLCFLFLSILAFKMLNIGKSCTKLVMTNRIKLGTKWDFFNYPINNFEIMPNKLSNPLLQATFHEIE